MGKTKIKPRCGQPQRSEQDGAVALERRDDGVYVLRATHDGVELHIMLGEYNAYRALGMLAMLLGANAGVNLLSKAGESIQISDLVQGRTAEMTVGYEPKNLGEKIAAHIMLNELGKAR